MANDVSELINVGDNTVLISHRLPLIWPTKISSLPMNLDPIFSLAGGLEKVYPGFYETPAGPLPESAE